MVIVGALAATAAILAFTGWTAFGPRRKRVSAEQERFWSIVAQEGDSTTTSRQEPAGQ
jgi:hypothetical protein